MPTEEDFANWVKDPMWPHPTMLGPEIKAIYAWFSARMKPVTPGSKVLEESLSEVIQKSSEIKEQFLKTFLACHVDASTTVETLKAIFDNWALAEQRDGTVIKWFMVPKPEMKPVIREPEWASTAHDLSPPSLARPVTIAPLSDEEILKLANVAYAKTRTHGSQIIDESSFNFDSFYRGYRAAEARILKGEL